MSLGPVIRGESSRCSHTRHLSITLTVVAIKISYSRDAFELMLGSVSDNGHSLEDCKTYLTTPSGVYGFDVPYFICTFFATLQLISLSFYFTQRWTHADLWSLQMGLSTSRSFAMRTVSRSPSCRGMVPDQFSLSHSHMDRSTDNVC